MAYVYKVVTLKINGGDSQPFSELYARTTTPGPYLDLYTDGGYINRFSGFADASHPSRPAKPARKCYSFKGYYTSTSGGARLLDEDGWYNRAQSISVDLTVYAQWSRVSYALTLDKQGGSGGTDELYGKSASPYGWFADDLCATAASSVTPPAKQGGRFLGYYSAANGSGTKYIDADGSFTSAFSSLHLSANMTLYAAWEERVEVTVDAQGGTLHTERFWYSNGAFYADVELTEEITSIDPPTRASGELLGIYTGTEGGTLAVSATGAFQSGWAPSEDCTIFAQWRNIVAVTLDPNGGDASLTAIYYDTSTGVFYDMGEEPVASIPLPVRECYGFLGYYEGSTQRIAANGTISTSWHPTAAVTLTASWQRVSGKMALDKQGGSGGTDAIYRNGSGWFADDQCTAPITTIVVPTKEGYRFDGYFTADQTYRNILADGRIVGSYASTTDVVGTNAHWLPNTYTLAFDYQGGTGTPASKSVTYGQAIGTLPTARKTGADFLGWKLNGSFITAQSVWGVAGNETAVAVYATDFGNVTDYFSLASAALVPIASDSGDDKQRICVSHTGKWESGVDAVSCVWRNPTVTYMVVADTNFSITLGNAFDSQGTVYTEISGYMIVSVKVSTSLGSVPTITVSAVANEGRDAINKFTLSNLRILARHRPQRLDSSIVGGGELLSLDLEAKCDPVVLAENMIPCASDVVHGAVKVTAVTAAYNREAAPTAGSGYTALGVPIAEDHVGYKTYTIKAERSM